jgi:hypothetical protein
LGFVDTTHQVSIDTDPQRPICPAVASTTTPENGCATMGFVNSQDEPLGITVVLFDGFELLDVCGPLEMFGLLADRFPISLVGLSSPARSPVPAVPIAVLS